MSGRPHRSGLSLNGFTDPRHFVTGLIARLPPGEFAEEIEPSRAALQTLLHPGFLGRHFNFRRWPGTRPSSGRCMIGQRGDYFTNVSVGPLFGRLSAAQFAEMWEQLGRPEDFVIVVRAGRTMPVHCLFSSFLH